MIGKTVSHYRIEEKLGQGGMGVVYRAEDTRLGRSVALKALTPEYARDPGRRQRFQQEARAAARLTHPGIAAVYELEEVGEDLYIVYEFVRGETLRAIIQRGHLPLDTLLDIAADVAAALAAAHAHGIVHRDIKPENIMRTPERDTKILDFGLARFQPSTLDSATRSAGLTDAGSIVGTVAYMSPEQLEGREADFRTDIFSFGVLLYELATGVRPFEGTSPASTIARVLTSEPVPMIQRNPITPPELDRIVRKCLRKRPEERYQSTRDLQVDLEELRRDATGGAPRAEAAVEEAGLLESALASFTLSPRRWWEANQIIYVIFNVVMIYIGWQVIGWVGGRRGLALFLGVVVCAAASTSLRVILLGTAAVTPRNLPAELRRVGPWTRLVDLSYTALLVVVAAHLLNSHPGWAALLLGMAVAGLVAFLIIDPTLTRAAFPTPEVARQEAVPEAVAEAGRRAGFRLLAGLRLAYVLPFAIFLRMTGPLLEDLPGMQREGYGSEAQFLTLVVAGNLVVLFLGAATALALWRGSRPVVEIFRRWFLLYLLADMVAAMVVMALMLKYAANIVAALLLLPVLVYLPFYQRRLARELLASFPEEAASKEREQAARQRRWPLALAVVALPALVVLAVAVSMNVGGLRERLARSFGTSTPRIESLAVLPLENLSRDPEQEYFADGMTEALISDLAHISALRVISRTSVMQYKGARRPLPEIARELNVDAVVEGSVQRAGDRVRITAQLIHAPTDKHLWAQSYERDLRDVLTLQSEVARAIAQEIKVKLTPQEQTRLAGAPAINPEAHELYLRGRHAWNKRTPAGMTKSIEYFNQALEHDPTNALIWAGLADSYNQLGYRGYLSPEGAYPRAKAAAAKALEINPTLAEAHAALGFALLNHDWDWPAAERALRRSLELNPNYAEAHHWYSHYLMDTGRVRESLEESQRALEVDPLSMIVSVHLGWHYISARQYDLALAHLRKTVAADPSYYSAHLQLGRAYQFQGAFAEAIAEQRKAAALSNNGTEALTALAAALALGGQREAATRILDQLKQMASTQYVSSCNIASVYAALGATSQSFEWLDKARQERASRLIELKTDPLFDPLRHDPRFAQLMRRMNFPP